MATWIIGAALSAIVAAVVAKLRRDRKKGASCGCGCKGCPSAGLCHPETK